MNIDTANRQAGALWTRLASLPHSHSDAPALSDARGRMTFRELYVSAEGLSRNLQDLGVGSNQLVYLSLPNSTDFVVCLLALLKLDAKIALVSPHYRDAELLAMIGHLSPHHVIASSSDVARVEGIKQTEMKWELSHIVNMDDVRILSSPVTQRPDIAGDRDILELYQALSIIKLSGGTTAAPKAIAMAAENMMSEAGNVVASLGLTSRDGILASVPLYHSYGFDLGVLGSLFSGAQLIIHEHFIPRKTMRALQDHASVFLGVPSMYRMLLEASLADHPDLSRVRYLLSCTAPLPPSTIDEFYERFGRPICQHYGSSETGAVATHLPGEVLTRKESVGKACHRVTVTVQDESDLTLSAGCRGEIVVTSDAVAIGYLMGKPPGRSRFEGRSFRTGDLGVMDGDGFITLAGRVDGIINVGGFKVSALQVTTVLESHPDVKEAAVLGVPDRFGQEVVYAMVALQRRISEQELREFCQGHLADYEVPRRIDIVDSVPRGPSGKIQLRPEDIAL